MRKSIIKKKKTTLMKTFSPFLFRWIPPGLATKKIFISVFIPAGNSRNLSVQTSFLYKSGMQHPLLKKINSQILYIYASFILLVSGCFEFLKRMQFLETFRGKTLKKYFDNWVVGIFCLSGSGASNGHWIFPTGP